MDKNEQSGGGGDGIAVLSHPTFHLHSNLRFLGYVAQGLHI